MDRENETAASGDAEGARLVLKAYTRLRLPGSAWRSQLGRLLRPLLRLHGYRDSSTRVRRQVVCRLDFGPGGKAAKGGCS